MQGLQITVEKHKKYKFSGGSAYLLRLVIGERARASLEGKFLSGTY